MFRDGFVEGGVERMKSQVHLTFIFDLDFFNFHCMERKKKRKEEGEKKRKGTKELRKRKLCVYPYISPIVTFQVTLLRFALLYFLCLVECSKELHT